MKVYDSSKHHNLKFMQYLANKQHSIASNLPNPSISETYDLSLLGHTALSSCEPSSILVLAEESAAN